MQAKWLASKQAKPHYKKEDGTVMTKEEIVAKKAAKYTEAGGEVRC